MQYNVVSIDEKYKDTYLEAYIADKIGCFKRKAILVIPGGAYSSIASEREGEPIAQAFMPYGFNAFVLHYSVGKEPFPLQLLQASKAMKHIKDNAEEYNINPDEVFVVGFSAGGHLAASLGTMWNNKDICKNIDMPVGYNKPAGMMLIYPVISSKYHTGSFKNLFMDKEVSEEKMQRCSIERCVTSETSPAFIMHTSNDQMVDVRNSLVLANALKENNIEFEMHIYPDAPHGIALANEITKCEEEKWCNSQIASWIDMAANWADEVAKRAGE